MPATVQDAIALRAEIAAFYAGFGQPGELHRAYRSAVLVVPVTDDDRVWTVRAGGVHWLPAFTSIEEYARFQNRRGILPDRDYPFHTFTGSTIAHYAASRTEPTGVLIDAAGAQPMSFPPTVSGETRVADV